MLGGVLEADWGLAESRLLMRSGSTTWFVPSGLPEEEVVVGLTLELFRNSSPSGWMARLSPGFMMQARATGTRGLGGRVAGYRMQISSKKTLQKCTAATLIRMPRGYQSRSSRRRSV